MGKNTSRWFLVGSIFENGQDTLWNLDDEPVPIPPPYIIGDEEFYKEAQSMFGHKITKKIIQAIDTDDYKEITGKEKIEILQEIYGVGTRIHSYDFFKNVNPDKLILYRII